MQERKTNKGLIAIIIIMFLIIVGLVVYIVLNNNTNKDVEQKEEVGTSENIVEEENKEDKEKEEELKLSDLYGTYSWQEDYTGVNGNGGNINLTRKIKLTLNADGTALYEASTGMDAESTKGIFTFENGNITYTRQYYNYDNSNTEYTGGQKTEFFKVVDKNTLTATVSNFNNISVTLTK